ncbi:hypothetical protein C2845_PM07G26060 [Panicum miliaceum]|uniref:Tr-type G domain-containing protein n=1 Tax=Panicum miliaceum TaxID=4540 RepID=A0A3L6SRD1_PANMI|nr:hypothetical protein C2845_PM07G26060 [Panicum miliaceum]
MAVVKNDEEAMLNAFSSVDMWMPRPGHSLELLVGGRHQTHSGTTEGPKLSKPEAGESGEKTGTLLLRIDGKSHGERCRGHHAQPAQGAQRLDRCSRGPWQVHGSTLTDSMLAAAGLMALEDAGKVRATDNRDDEAERGISIKATAVSLGYDFRAMRTGTATSDTYVVNLVDCPGHVDFSPEVTAALRLTDGALVVVDCVEGVCVQTWTVLRQALGERIKPVLVVNKLDRFFLELKLDAGEKAYQALRRVVEEANAVVAMYSDNELGNCHMPPENGTVAFAAGLHGWAFTLSSFAKLYSSRSGVDEAKLRARLWGDNFFDPATKKWTTCHTGSAMCERGFVRFCYNPVRKAEVVPAGDRTGRMYAFGREFSGKVASGNKVRVISNKYLPGGGGKEDAFVKGVQRTGLMKIASTSNDVLAGLLHVALHQWISLR